VHGQGTGQVQALAELGDVHAGIGGRG